MSPRKHHRGAFRLLLGVAAVTLIAGCATLVPGLSSQVGDRALRVGVNYHAVGPDHVRDSFLGRYHEPEVRQMVKRQLREMTEMGAQVVKTTLWVAAEPSSDALPPDLSWVVRFPPSIQEIANLTAYVQDVGDTPLRLEVALAWLGCANYWTAAPLTGADDEIVATACRVQWTWGQFERVVQATYDDVLAALAHITRADGTRVVSLVHGEIEVDLHTKPNQLLFLRRLWPYFASAARSAGLEPSFYFVVDANETKPNAQSLLDAIRFMLDHGIPDIPARLDFSFYPMKAWKKPWNGEWFPTTEYRRITRAIVKDIETRVFPLTGPRPLGIAETQYPVEARERLALGQAIAQEAARGHLIVQALFWPQSASVRYRAAPPFDFASYAETVRAGVSAGAASP